MKMSFNSYTFTYKGRSGVELLFLKAVMSRCARCIMLLVCVTGCYHFPKILLLLSAAFMLYVECKSSPDYSTALMLHF